MLHESIVLLRRSLGERLEPVGVMGGSHLHRPPFHAFGHLVGYVAVEGRTVVYRVGKAGKYRRRQIAEHLFTVEHILAEIFARPFRRHGHFVRSCLKRFFYYSESQCCHNVS